jgi:hypothetical protein
MPTRRERLTNIAMQRHKDYSVNLFAANMPKTVLANEYTRDLAVYANAVLLRTKNSVTQESEVLAIHNNLT